MDSAERAGDWGTPGDFNCFAFEGDGAGVEGPLNDANLPLSILRAVLGRLSEMSGDYLRLFVLRLGLMRPGPRERETRPQTLRLCDRKSCALPLTTTTSTSLSWYSDWNDSTSNA